jgi:hypothetical protein
MNCNVKLNETNMNSNTPATIQVNFQEYQDLNRKLIEAEKNLHTKIEIIVALESFIAINGTEGMKNEMIKLIADVIKREG